MSEFKLTANQKEAVETLKGNVAVCAGAGTGKTRVLVERFVEIIERKLAVPTEILAITFTDKAANEMKSRIVGELKKRNLTQAYQEIESAYIGTIHSFCSRVLKEHPIEAGIDPEFRVIEEDEADILKESVLDSIIENRFSETPVFELLRAYDEDHVREGIKEIHGKISTLGISIEEALSHKTSFDQKTLKNELIHALKDLGKFAKKAEVVQDVLLQLEKNQAVSWEAVNELRLLDKSFKRQGKEGREEIEEVKSAFSRLIGAQMDELVLPFKQTFQSLLSEFAKEYQRQKRALASFDFNDLQIKAVELLSGTNSASVAIREQYQKHFKFIMVDEFQDTNDSQVKLLDLIQNGSNLFLVGDAKQSIYGFRGTNPAFFLQKTAQFEKEKTGCQIALSDNFRSRSEILEFVNHFFNGLWQENSNSNFLIAGREFPKSKQPSIELLEIENGEDSKGVDELRKKEAKIIASRIRELVDSGEFRYRDIALLFRATTQMHIYEREFRNFQIPYYLIDGRGFYHQPEIKDLMNFLTIIENPLKDVPLAGVMRSPMFRVNDDSLFWLARFAKKTDKYKPLYSALHSLADIPEIAEDQRKQISEFKSFLDELIRAKENPGVAETIEWMLRKTSYDLYVLGLPEGKRHFANLRKLIDLARELEERKTIHLGDFVRYIKGLEAIEVRESEAQVEAAEGEVVRLLTIHKAKGLEFPVCILPDLLYPPRNQEGRMIFHPNFGIGLRAPDPESDEFEETLTYETIKDEFAASQAEEGKRLFYVAMTRAMKRLVLSMIVPDKSKEAIASWNTRIHEVIKTKNIPVHILKHEVEEKKFGKKLALAERKGTKEYTEKLVEIPLPQTPKTIPQLLSQLEPLTFEEFDRIDLPVSAYVAYLRDEAHSEYVATYELGAPLIASSDLKNEDLAVQEENAITAADFGTVVHRVFEHLLLFRKNKKNLDELISFFTASLNEETIQRIKQLSETFTKSHVYSDVEHAKRYFTELPFVLRLSRGIVQGSLDLLYQTKNDEWVIVDYKTSEITKDEVKTKGESYRAQMELYSLACAEIIGKMPQKAILYFVKPDAIYEIPFSSDQMEALREKYEDLQHEIIQFRGKLKKGEISYAV